VGFDHDDEDIFDMQYEFIQKACIPSLAINMLKAPLGTRLWTRLRREGRVVSVSSLAGKGHPRTYTNVVPKKLSRLQLLLGYGGLLERVHGWEAFAERIRGFVSLVQRTPRVREAEVRLRALQGLGARLGVDPVGCRLIDAMLEHTAEVAPFMLGRVKRLIVQQAKYLGTLQKFWPQFDQQIALESRPDFQLELDNRAIHLPEGFREAFDGIFPQVHRRVYLNLTDKSQVPEALTEVFVDFLVRWGEEFKGFEEYHRAFLNEICDRTCAKWNGQPPEAFVAVESADLVEPDVRRRRLGDDILKSVDQEIAKLVKAGGRAGRQ
jgi:hypothetical protein